MSVAEALARIDAGAMIDNALARVRRNAGVRPVKPTASVHDYLESLGLNCQSLDTAIKPAANLGHPEPSHMPWRSSTVVRRHARRERRALRG